MASMACSWVEAAVLSLEEIEELIALLDVEDDWGFEASKVHTVRGDEVLPTRRNSQSVTGRSSEVFDYLSANVLPRLQSFEAAGTCIEVVRNHYDVVAYAAGGFFAAHVDHVPCRAPSVTIWHGLLCLAAEGCVGGCTAVYTLKETWRLV